MTQATTYNLLTGTLAYARFHASAFFNEEIQDSRSNKSLDSFIQEAIEKNQKREEQSEKPIKNFSFGNPTGW